MKIHFLGTCAGTEPMPDCKHASVIFEYNDAFYWFDAGEGCSYTAHNLGLDLLKTKTIFISHTHMDHIGGLGNLLWNIRKLYGVKKELPKYDPIRLYIPNEEVGDALLNHVLAHTEGNFKCDFSIEQHGVTEGVLFSDEAVCVTAYKNNHLADGRSFSYRFQTDKSRIVYSGDVKDYRELDRAIGDGCDALTIETGHFKIADAYEYTKTKNIGKIFFTHNGREILYDRKGSEEKVRKLFGDRAGIAFDGMSVNI